MKSGTVRSALSRGSFALGLAISVASGCAGKRSVVTMDGEGAHGTADAGDAAGGSGSNPDAGDAGTSGSDADAGRPCENVDDCPVGPSRTVCDPSTHRCVVPCRNLVLDGMDWRSFGPSEPCPEGMDCFDQDGSVYYDVGACYQGCDPDDGTGCPAGTACDVGGICKRLSNAGPGERCTGSLETFACSEGYYCGHDGLCHGSCDYWGSGLSCPTNEQCTPYSQADENGGICVESPRYGTDPAEIGELCTTLYAGCGDDGVELRGECRFGCHAADCSACGESCMTCLKDCRTDAECTVDYPRCTSDGCVESIEPAP